MKAVVLSNKRGKKQRRHGLGFGSKDADEMCRRRLVPHGDSIE